jgi:hypothetical protein
VCRDFRPGIALYRSLQIPAHCGGLPLKTKPMDQHAVWAFVGGRWYTLTPDAAAVLAPINGRDAADPAFMSDSARSRCKSPACRVSVEERGRYTPLV